MESAAPKDRSELYDLINKLPLDRQYEAMALAVEFYGTDSNKPRSEGLTRDIEQRRAFDGLPGKYFCDVLGYHVITDQQEEMLRTIEDPKNGTQFIIATGNNLGKSFIIACYADYVFDVKGSLPDDLGNERGCRVILPGPNYNTVRETIYAEIRKHADRAELRGYLMPGIRSERAVNWYVPGRPGWRMEAMAPQHRAGRRVAHSISGRHHVHQYAFIEELAAVEEDVIASVEGQCSGAGNLIVGMLNPTEPHGAAFIRHNDGRYKILHFSAFDHPNVRRRMIVIPGAVDFTKLDERVRNECIDRGPAAENPPDVKQSDFVYGLKVNPNDPEKGPRKDGALGMAGTKLHTYRPRADKQFEPQVLGIYPRGSDRRLFNAQAWDQAVLRWKSSPDPTDAPDLVGVDPAGTGGNNKAAAPRWGDGAELLLRGYMRARDKGERELKRYCAEHGCRVGWIRLMTSPDGPGLADELVAAFPNTVFNVDDGWGRSTIHHLKHLRRDVQAITFGGSPPEPTPGESWGENIRVAMYLRAARLVEFGLVDVPDDPVLREEIMAYEIRKVSVRVVEEATSMGRTEKVRRSYVQITEKDEIKKRIGGRSPDRADAFVMALLDAPPKVIVAPLMITPQRRRSAFDGDSPASSIWGE